MFKREEMLNKKVGVLYGGVSSEREVSLKSGAAVAKALESIGYNIALIDAKERMIEKIREENVEIAWLALHGKWGEDGCVQGAMELLKIPYTGSSVTASALGMNKEYSNMLFERAGLKIPQTRVVRRERLADFAAEELDIEPPFVVKPVGEGSSVGVTIVKELSALRAALAKVEALKDDAMIQRYIKGKEVHVGLLNGKALGAILIVPASEFYDYDAKYVTRQTRYIYPAPLDPAVYENSLDCAKKAYDALGCDGVSRVDEIIDERGDIYVLENNSLPGMTETSLVPKIASGLGISFERLCEEILLGASLKIN